MRLTLTHTLTRCQLSPTESSTSSSPVLVCVLTEGVDGGGRVATDSSIEEDLDTVLSSLLQLSTDLLLNTLTSIATAVGELSGQL